MPDGTMTPPEIATRISSQEVRAPEPQNFTPLPELGKPTMTEPPHQEPTDTAEVDKLMELLGQQKNTAVRPPLVSELPVTPKTEKKPQGFIARIIEWIKNLFKNLFR